MARAPDDRPPAGRDPGLHRVRVGVTGLAAVFLLTLLAASIFALLGQDTHSPSRLAQQAGTNAATGDDQPKEPLAELGVAPGNAPKIPAAGAASQPVVTLASPPAAPLIRPHTPPAPAKPAR